MYSKLSLIIAAAFVMSSTALFGAIEPVFVQLERNGKEFPKVVKMNDELYQVYRNSEQAGTDEEYYFADTDGKRHWLVEAGSQEFTVNYLDGENLVSLDDATKDLREQLASADAPSAGIESLKIDSDDKVQLVGYPHGYYGYGRTRFVSYRSYGHYHHSGYYHRRVRSFHYGRGYGYRHHVRYRHRSYGAYYRPYRTYSYSYSTYAPRYAYGYAPSYSYSYRAYSTPIVYDTYRYIGPRYTVCLYDGYYG